MDAALFDDLVRRAGERLHRRQLAGFGGVVALAVAAPALVDDTEAAGRSRKVRGEHNRRDGGKKTILCFEGETVRVATKRRKKWLRKGATRGKCDGTCTPVCPPGTCGDDGCGGACPTCAVGEVCAAGICQTCTTSCGRDPLACGAALNVAMEGGGDIYVCPGTYQNPGGFSIAIDAGVTGLYGAGSGDDPTSNTIFNVGKQRAVVVTSTTPLTLSGIRVTGGGADEPGAGGVMSTSESLTVINCAIVGNIGADTGGLEATGAVTMINSVVSGNTSAGMDSVGGMRLAPGAAGLESVITNSVIDGNEGAIVGGVLIETTMGDQTLTVSTDSAVTNNMTTSGTPLAGGIALTGPGSADATGATVGGNTGVQCSGVNGC